MHIPECEYRAFIDEGRDICDLQTIVHFLDRLMSVFRYRKFENANEVHGSLTERVRFRRLAAIRGGRKAKVRLAGTFLDDSTNTE